MTEKDFNYKMKEKLEAIALIKPMLPENFVPKESCKKCGSGIIWGIKNDDGEINYLRSEETGSLILSCGDCQIDLANRVEESRIKIRSQKLAKYEEYLKKNNLSFGARMKTNDQKESKGGF